MQIYPFLRFSMMAIGSILMLVAMHPSAHAQEQLPEDIEGYFDTAELVQPNQLSMAPPLGLNVPETKSYTDDSHWDREVVPKPFFWLSPSFSHRPLVFEDPMLERHGVEADLEPVQVVISGLKFYSRVVCFPITLLKQRPRLVQIPKLGGQPIRSSRRVMTSGTSDPHSRRMQFSAETPSRLQTARRNQNLPSTALNVPPAPPSNRRPAHKRTVR